MIPGLPKVRRQGSRIVVSNEYWEVEHDARRGGCPTSLIFRHGSGQNYLVKPLSAHFAVNEPTAWATFYRQSDDRRASMDVKPLPDGVELAIRGSFTSPAGKRLPVDYVQTYRYLTYGLVKIDLTVILKEPLKRKVVEFSPCSFYVGERTDLIGVRPSGYAGARPPEPAVEWREVAYGRSYRDRRPPALNYPPLYVCVLEKGVEGIEFYRGEDSEPWDQPFGLEPGGAVFRANPVPKGTAFFGAERDSFFVENNLICNWGDFVSLPRGRKTFSYSLGLPFVKPAREARKHVFHACVQPRPSWPDTATLKRWAECGVTVLRLHDDNTFVKPSWPDGLYPPYPPDVMAGMDRMIDTAHQFGMKIVPYFSLKEFHPSCPAYRANVQAWKRQSTADAHAVESERGPYGGYMCMASGWLDYRKQSIDLVLRKHAFDGVYYDHTWPRVCRHPAHRNGHVHTDMDEVLDFLRWSRERVGPDGYVFLHNSATPTMVGENLSDLVYLGEHTDPSIPLPGRMSPDMEFVPIAPRNGIVYGPWKSPDEAVLAHLLEGWPITVSRTTTSVEADDFTLTQYRALSRQGLDSYNFLRAGERPVDTGHPDVFASVYTRRDKVLIYAANLGRRRVSARLRPDWARIGWRNARSITVHGAGRTLKRSAAEFDRNGLALTLASDQAVLIECSR